MVRIFEIGYTDKAPPIAATPNNDQFWREIMRDLDTLPADATIPPFQLIRAPFTTAKGFFNLPSKALVFTERVLSSSLGEFLEYSGNIHKTQLNDTGEEIFFLNITACYNCMDRNNTTFNAPNGEELGVDHEMGIRKPAFFPNLIDESLIFKIPNMSHLILVASDDTGHSQDFYRAYQESGLEELKFNLVWEGEGHL